MDDIEAEPIAEIQAAPAERTPALTDLAQNALVELEDWRVKHIANSPFSRNTPAYNRIQAALNEIGSVIASVKE
jgi:hypothetical protein